MPRPRIAVRTRGKQRRAAAAGRTAASTAGPTVITVSLCGTGITISNVAGTMVQWYRAVIAAPLRRMLFVVPNAIIITKDK